MPTGSATSGGKMPSRKRGGRGTRPLLSSERSNAPRNRMLVSVSPRLGYESTRIPTCSHDVVDKSHLDPGELVRAHPGGSGVEVRAVESRVGDPEQFDE